MIRIVTAAKLRYQRRKKRPAKAIEIIAPIVTAKKPAKRQRRLKDDSEPVSEEVKAFVRRMMGRPD